MPIYDFLSFYICIKMYNLGKIVKSVQTETEWWFSHEKPFFFFARKGFAYEKGCIFKVLVVFGLCFCTFSAFIIFMI